MEKENEDLETIIIEREETTVITNGGEPMTNIRKCLNPLATSITEASFPSLTRVFETISDDNLSKWRLSGIQFKGWRNPKDNKWKTWADELSVSHGYEWNKVNICEAISTSTYKIDIHKELILGLVDFWCPETNTFVFPWGETTITLEDMLILGGFPILGEPVTSPLTGDLLKILDELEKEHKALYKEPSRKPSEGGWTKRFMGSKSELQHVAFLSLWLSRYVFPEHPEQIIKKKVFPVAIHLAEGKLIALAPAVLASLYTNLTSLKKQLLQSSPSISVWGPFQFLQVWAWERLPLLRPEAPKSLNSAEPRVACWSKLRSKLSLSNVRSILKCSENFQWRPYAATISNRSYVGIEDYEFQFFFRCLRSCEIFGLNGQIQLYLPHRVARQFGYDQDLPGQFCGANSTWESAWNVYDKCTRNPEFYIRSQTSEPYVTIRYQEWWKQSMSINRDAIMDTRLRKKRFKCSASKSDCPAPSKCSAFNPNSQSIPESQDSSDEDDKLTLSVKFNFERRDSPATDIPTSVTTCKPSSSSQAKRSRLSTSEVGEKKRNSGTQHAEQEGKRKVVQKSVEKCVEKEKKIGDSQYPAAAVPNRGTTCKPSSSSQTKQPVAATMSEEGNEKGKPDTQHVEQNVKGKVVKKSVDKCVEKDKIGDSLYNPLTVDDDEEGTRDKPIYLDV